MRRSTTFTTALSLAVALMTGCYEEGTQCRYELACANQEGLIATCCHDDVFTKTLAPIDAYCANDGIDTAEACEEAGLSWSDTDGGCSFDTVSSEDACEAAGHQWTDEVPEREVQIPTSTCWYETPDGTTFECDPIEDEANAKPFCARAVEDLTAHCSD